MVVVKVQHDRQRHRRLRRRQHDDEQAEDLPLHLEGGAVMGWAGLPPPSLGCTGRGALTHASAIASTPNVSSPTAVAMAHSAAPMRMLMNGPCAVSITPKTTSTSVPPT